MEMTITVHIRRRRPAPVDVVVRWAGVHTAADLAAALAHHIGEPVPSLTAGGRPVDPSTRVGMPPLVHGASVAVGGRGRGGAAREGPTGGSGTVLDLVVVGGPDSGRSHPLSPPGVQVGRSAAGGGLTVDDEALSRVHATVHVGPSGIVVDDAGSTNGVVVDGRSTIGVTPVDGSSTIVLGSSTLRLRRAGGVGLQLHAEGDGRILLRSAPADVTPPRAVEVERPPPPVKPHRARMPWVGALVPLPIAGALALVLGPQLLLFALVGPLGLVANALADRWGSGRAHRRALADHAGALRRARERLDRALREEVARLDAAYPDPHAVLTTAERRLPRLWGGDDLGVRLGLGDVPTAVAWVDGTTRSHPLARGAPVVVDLAEVGCLGLVGPRAVTDRLLANVVGQLCTRHPPGRLALTVTAAEPSWAWTGWMPHADPHWCLEGTAAGVEPAPRRVVVVPSPDARMVPQLVARARAEGAIVVVAATAAGRLPSACTAVVHGIGHGQHTLTHDGTDTVLTLDLVGAWWAERLSRALAPLWPAGEHHRTGRQGPVTLGEVLGERRLTAAAVLSRWAEATTAGHAAPVAAVGLRDGAVHHIDLLRDGPHVLVGGTTGSGKSEFLRTLVTSLALGSPPEDLAFVLVDFKGGAAFGPCADLPHVVGLVTDLDEHLVDRALTSLRAELRRRERLFAAAAVSDLAGYLRSRGPDDEPVPRLVVLVDELRALVDEVPGFVSGMVRLAALGRSLGVHLVLATQRPAGVVTPEIQANVNLRIAFRVRDRSDSLDILDDPAAATLPPGSPGRALARAGDGSLVGFQAAVVAPAPDEDGPFLSVATVGEPLRAPAPRSPLPHQRAGAEAAERRLTEVSEVVTAVRDAHRSTGAPPPRAPWLPPLPRHIAPWGMPTGTAAPPVVAGVVDEPDLQRMSPLAWTPAGGPWLLVGRPGSGRSTAARAVVLAAATAHDVDHLHIHVVDTTGSLSDLVALPHVGSRVSTHDTRAVAGLTAHLREEVDRRRSASDSGIPHGGSPAPQVLLVVDGWERLVEAHPDAGDRAVADDLVRVLRDGHGAGLAGLVTGGRSLLQPTWSGLGGSAFLLGTVDPLDAALAGLRASDLTRMPPPGRAVRVTDRRSVQFAAATADVTAEVAARASRATRGDRPFRLLPLPTVVRRTPGRPPPAQTAAGRGAGSSEATCALRLALGVAGRSASTWEWVPDRVGRRLLVAGPPRSGRTNVLRVLGESAVGAGLPVVLVSARPGSSGVSRAGVTVLAQQDVDALVALRRAHPDLAVLVDDADRLDDAPIVAVLREIAGLVDRDGGLVVMTTSPTAVLGRLRGLDVELARHRTGLLLSPRPGDGDVLGLRRLDGIPPIAGRGLFCTPTDVTELQVFLAEAGAEPADAGSGPRLGAGADVVGVPHGQRRQDADEGHDQHDPTGEDLRAPDQADPDGQQQRVPDDRRGPRPRGPDQPATADEGQRDGTDEDQQGRHQHPRGVASLPDHQLVDVERGEAQERQRLQAGEERGQAAGAA